MVQSNLLTVFEQDSILFGEDFILFRSSSTQKFNLLKFFFKSSLTCQCTPSKFEVHSLLLLLLLLDFWKSAFCDVIKGIGAAMFLSTSKHDDGSAKPQFIWQAAKIEFC